MRVLVDDTEYPTIKKAMETLKITYKKLLKEHKVERLYFSGYWNEVEKETLKDIGRYKRQQKLSKEYCFIDTD